MYNEQRMAMRASQASHTKLRDIFVAMPAAGWPAGRSVLTALTTVIV